MTIASWADVKPRSTSPWMISLIRFRTLLSRPTSAGLPLMTSGLTLTISSGASSPLGVPTGIPLTCTLLRPFTATLDTSTAKKPVFSSMAETSTATPLTNTWREGMALRTAK